MREYVIFLRMAVIFSGLGFDINYLVQFEKYA